MKPRPGSLGAPGAAHWTVGSGEVTRQPHGDLVPSAVALRPGSEGATRRAAGGGGRGFPGTRARARGNTIRSTPSRDELERPLP